MERQQNVTVITGNGLEFKRRGFMWWYNNRSRESFFFMREKRNAYRILVGKLEGKRPLGRPRCE
jgi:hypothetical protein